MLLKKPESDMIHNNYNLADKALNALFPNTDWTFSDLTSFANGSNESFWSTLSPLCAEIVKDKDEMLEECDFFADPVDDNFINNGVMYRDVSWSAYSLEKSIYLDESIFIKQEIADNEELTYLKSSLVSYSSDGSITPVEDGCLTPTDDGSLATTEDENESGSPSEDDSFRSEVIRPYTPNVDHSYHLVPTFADPGLVKCEEEEKNVDIWNKAEELDQCTPAPITRPSRKNMRRNRATKTVSINKAANVALKRTKSSKVAPKRQTIKNSVETTPSSSDTEDMSKYSLLRDSVFNRRGAKSSAIQAINRCTNTKVERSSKRSDHNKMEKKRRQELRELYERLKNNIPAENFRGGSEKVRTNPSKQQILITARKYLKELAKEESKDKQDRRFERRRNAQNLHQFNKVFHKVLTSINARH